MKKLISLVTILLIASFANSSKAQTEDIYSRSQKIYKLLNRGDFVNAGKYLLQIVNSENKIPNEYKVFIYNSLGATSTLFGRYSDALKYYNLAEKSVYTKADTSLYLGGIYVNKALIYKYQESYSMAIEYYEKGIRVYTNINNPDVRIFDFISTSYLDYGIVLYETGEFNSALKYLGKSKEIKLKYKLPGLAFVDLNIAETYVKLSRLNEAEKYFKESRDLLISEFGRNYYRLPEIYFVYGQFLYSSGRYNESLETLKQALSICLNNFGIKHSFTSFSYKLIGDYYKNQSDYDTALKYYQESLISVVGDFNDPDIFTNPSIDSSLFDIRLLDDLKCKARALELFAGEQNLAEMKLKFLNESLETIGLALQVIDRIRNNYFTEESRLYLADNEKETYIFAAHVAFTLYNMTGEKALAIKMYSIAQKSKAMVLRNEITENELLMDSAVPDTLRQKQNHLKTSIAAYNKLIMDELAKVPPDSSRIALWKDALFKMNRANEKITADIGSRFPQYRELLLKTEPVTLVEIQKKLRGNQTIIDYLLSNQVSGGKRTLSVFVITRNSLEIREISVDSTFIINAAIIRKNNNPEAHTAGNQKLFTDYTGALSFMYGSLIKPVEDLIKGKRIIIIPDEEIAWLPFDAFLKKLPQPGQTDYESLQYLINDYTFSRAYSSSLIFGSKWRLKKGEELFAFSPDYGNNAPGGTTINKLRGAEDEIGSLFRWFGGRKFTGSQATGTNFRESLKRTAIFHLAMHSVSDSVNSKYSYLLFDTKNDTAGDGKLYNYEISLARIASPMVVLSACNSGTGTLYHGEGLMSLARGFMLAGASSVIRTSWEVNDESSGAIITRFYRYLSEGFTKDKAMRLAKIEYIKNTPPEYSNPYYWAAYEVLGDTQRVTQGKRPYYIIFLLIAAVSAGFVILYLRRRRISRARSL